MDNKETIFRKIKDLERHHGYQVPFNYTIDSSYEELNYIYQILLKQQEQDREKALIKDFQWCINKLCEHLLNKVCDPPPKTIYDEMAFQFATCKCSKRTAQEEELYGSYCDDCWSSVKKHMKCIICEKSVYDELLYVDSKFRVPTCKKCFVLRDFDEIVKSRGFTLNLD